MADSHDVVIFGAGCIGRGLIAEIVGSAGLRPVLVEADAGLARGLAEAGSYRVRLVGRRRRVAEVGGYEVLTSGDSGRVAAAIATCCFAVTAVGGTHLPEVARPLAAGVERRAAPLNVMLCENVPHSDAVLGQALGEAGAPPGRVACVRASVERIVRRVPGSLDLIGEEGQTLYVDGSAWEGSIPEVPGMIVCDGLEPLYARKLFTNNAGHALLAYLGAREGCELVHEAAARPAIRQHLLALLALAGRALVLRYEGDEAAMDEHLHSLSAWRFANRELADPVRRVARDPLRKLGPGERLVGLIRLLQSCGLPTEPVSRVVGAALHYFDPDDAQSVQLRDMILESGAERVLQSVCGFDRDEACFGECVRFYASP